MSEAPSADDMSIDDHIELGTASVNRLIENRRATSTKNRYGTALRSIARWLKDLVPPELESTVFTKDDQGKLIPRIPIEEKYLITFIGYINEQDQYGTYTVQGGEEEQKIPVEKNRRKGKRSIAETPSSSSSSNRFTRSTTASASSSSDPIAPLRKGYAVSTMEGFWSALKYAYEKAGHRLSNDIQQKFAGALEGYKHKIADMELEGIGGRSNTKGMMDIGQIQRLAEYSFKTDPLFTWPYFVIEWNLSSRKNSVASLMLHHLSWNSDSLVIDLVKTKSRQDGKSRYSAFIHLYANPSIPYFCPILAVAMIIFTKSLSSSYREGLRLFEGNTDSASERFTQRLNEGLKQLFGVELAKYYGAHSTRKSSITYGNSHTHGPPALAVSLRADHKVLGDIYARYIVQGEGSDQYAGRTAAGLPLHQVEFAILPPHFSSKTAPPTEDEWLLIVPNYLFFPVNMKPILPFLLARILEAKEYILEEIPATNPCYSRIINAAVFKSFSGSNSFLKRYEKEGTIHSSCYTRCLDANLYGTGIPLWVNQEKERKETRESIERLAEGVQMVGRLESVLHMTEESAIRLNNTSLLLEKRARAFDHLPLPSPLTTTTIITTTTTSISSSSSSSSSSSTPLSSPKIRTYGERRGDTIF